MPTGHLPPSSAWQNVFASVFPSSISNASQPTPNATPMLGSSAPGQSFGGFNSGPTNLTPIRTKGQSLDFVAEQLKSSRQWHQATAFLRIPERQITPDMISLSSANLHKQWTRPPDHLAQEAIEALVPLSSQVSAEAAEDADADILDWYKHEVRRHFLRFVKPGLLLDFADEDARNTLLRLLSTLEVAQEIYLYPLTNHLLPVLAFSCDPIAEPDAWESIQQLIRQIERSFRHGFYAIVVNSLPQKLFMDTLKKYLLPKIVTVLALEDDEDAQDEGKREDDMEIDIPLDTEQSKQARVAIIKTFKKLELVGLGGPPAQQAVAEVMNAMLSKYIEKTYSKRWESPSQASQNIELWIENRFARLIVEILHQSTKRDSPKTSGKKEKARPDVSFGDFITWRQIGMERLGRLRVDELFDIVVEWDASLGAVEDLKSYTTAPATRNHLAKTLSAALTKRLLHPGASTTEILQLYISLIRCFAVLDPPGVLLDRVARPVRRYLREREDTAKVIVAGLLADADEDGGDEDVGGNAEDNVLTILAMELSRTAEFVKPGLGDDADMDYDDLSWVPDPVDAGPEFKKSKSSDIIGSLISLFDSKEVFVKEFQTNMGERLLRKDFDLQKETRILELLKMRFDETSLQACAVMLRDVQDSARVDTAIRDDPKLSGRDAAPEAQPDNNNPAQFHTKFLSRLFWPALHDDEFKIPPEIVHLQKQYERGFETLKPSRKLGWLNALGQVTVELDLEDREVRQEVTPWQASVIYAFQHDGEEQEQEQEDERPMSRTVGELQQLLEMDEALVRRALTFWVGERVLREDNDGKNISYTVLETLDDDNMDPEAAQAAAMAAAEAEALGEGAMSAVKSADEVAMDKMNMYWQFIVGMLTNRGPMPLQGIITMLQFAVPGGFPYSSEELREFLGQMAREDRLEVVAGKYKIKS